MIILLLFILVEVSFPFLPSFSSLPSPPLPLSPSSFPSSCYSSYSWSSLFPLFPLLSSLPFPLYLPFIAPSYSWRSLFPPFPSPLFFLLFSFLPLYLLSFLMLHSSSFLFTYFLVLFPPFFLLPSQEDPFSTLSPFYLFLHTLYYRSFPLPPLHNLYFPGF